MSSDFAHVGQGDVHTNGLYDFAMPVGGTGVVFVAGLTGVLREWGPVFTAIAMQAAYRRAGSTLAQWGVVNAETFGFLAQAAELTPNDLATRYGVSLPTVQGWLDGSIPVPSAVWRCLAALVCFLDGRNLSDVAIPPGSMVPRVIRVVPNIPTPSMVPSSPGCPCPPVPIC